MAAFTWRIPETEVYQVLIDFLLSKGLVKTCWHVHLQQKKKSCLDLKKKVSKEVSSKSIE